MPPKTKEDDTGIVPAHSRDSPKGKEKIPNADSDQDPDQGPHLTDPGHGPDPSQAQGRHLRQSPEWVMTAVGETAQRRAGRASILGNLSRLGVRPRQW